MSTASHVLLRAEGLRRVAADGTLLLDDVSLVVAAGESVALLGPPGSGKTLLLRALAMLDPLEGGDVRLSEELVSDDAVPKFRLQVIHVQQRATLVEGTVRENLQFPYSFGNRRHQAYDESPITTWLQAVGREPAFLDRSTADLSGGESQIVALLRAMQLDPAVLLLDEPTSSLDQQTSSQVESLMRQWLQEDTGRAMLIVTHDEAQAERLADRVIRLDRGQLVDDGGGVP